MYGLSRHYTAVLTGYNLHADKTKPRSNKGVLYGLNAKVRPSITGKARFLFHSDFEMPFIKHGEGDEFCCHIYAPPFQMGPTLKRALGTRYNDPERFFGSDEKLDMIIKKEGNPNSRKITSCCFIID
ncbi:hypothetical protein MACJ_002455 [Theileria orientalis]|uniref:Uncharacterized protein n=1 Tax=Theileria orientalis TaxID=68886 RepID=A0A976M8L8_THEOR|nr:hypothetical protein MACJ_002455 [Theileria orientalis]